MNTEKTMLCVERSSLEKVSKELLMLSDEASDLIRYYCLIVAAGTDYDGVPADQQWANCMTLLTLYLNYWDRARLVEFVEGVHQTQGRLREVLDAATVIRAS